MLAVKRVAEIGVIFVGNLPLRLRPERVLLGLDQKCPVSSEHEKALVSSRETCQVTWGWSTDDGRWMTPASDTRQLGCVLEELSLVYTGVPRTPRKEHVRSRS